MSNSVPAIPEGMHSANISLVVSPCAEAIDFYKKAFSAEELLRLEAPDGSIAHAEIRIGDSIIMLSDEVPDFPVKSPTTLNGSTSAVFLYSDEIDELWDQAVEAGATIIYPLELQFYGHKGGRLQDPYGHTWGLGQQLEILSEEEMIARSAEFFSEQSQDF